MKVYAVACFVWRRSPVTSRQVATEFGISMGAARQLLLHCRDLGWVTAHEQQHLAVGCPAAVLWRAREVDALPGR